MNVLSLFDGISCGQVALERAGIEITNYLASELDKNAIKVTQSNHPNTIQIGDVTKVKGADLPKIDLLIGGSPCQGFSFAGKQLNFDDPRSKLFFEFVRLLKECKPKFFLLENVKMKKEYQDVISDYLGVQPLEINSSLVSAQNRKRLYWTNIPNVSIPKDKKLELSGIVEDSPIEYWGCAVRGRYNSDGSTTQKLEISKSKKSNALTTVKKDSMVAAAIRNQVTKDGVKEFLNIRKDLKSNCVVGSFYKKLNGVLCDGYYRTLTAIECERLQTLPDGYTNVISETQRYRALGNGWTVDVIAHIFKNFKKDYK